MYLLFYRKNHIDFLANLVFEGKNKTQLLMIHLTQYKAPTLSAALLNNGVRLIKVWNFNCLLVYLFPFLLSIPLPTSLLNIIFI